MVRLFFRTLVATLFAATATMSTGCMLVAHKASDHVAGKRGERLLSHQTESEERARSDYRIEVDLSRFPLMAVKAIETVRFDVTGKEIYEERWGERCPEIGGLTFFLMIVESMCIYGFPVALACLPGDLMLAPVGKKRRDGNCLMKADDWTREVSRPGRWTREESIPIRAGFIRVTARIGNRALGLPRRFPLDAEGTATFLPSAMQLSEEEWIAERVMLAVELCGEATDCLAKATVGLDR